jgi:hypothetical protein
VTQPKERAGEYLEVSAYRPIRLFVKARPGIESEPRGKTQLPPSTFARASIRTSPTMRSRFPSDSLADVFGRPNYDC